MACFKTDFSMPPTTAMSPTAQADSFISGNPNLPSKGATKSIGGGQATTNLFDNGYIGVLSGGSGTCGTVNITENICQTIIKNGGASDISNNQIINECGASPDGSGGQKLNCCELQPNVRSQQDACKTASCTPSPSPPSPSPPSPSPPSPRPHRHRPHRHRPHHHRHPLEVRNSVDFARRGNHRIRRRAVEKDPRSNIFVKALLWSVSCMIAQCIRRPTACRRGQS